MGQTVTLRKVGGSTMLALPKTVLDTLDIAALSEVDLTIEGDKMILAKHKDFPEYDLDEMLAQCDFSIPRSKEDQEWLDMPSVGKEIIE